MKHVFLLLVLLMSATSFSQSNPKGMTKIDGFQEEVVTVEVNATVLTSNESVVYAVSRNGRDNYEIKTTAVLQKNYEYFLILEVPLCTDCITIPATLKGYEISIKQAYDNIAKTKETVASRKEKE